MQSSNVISKELQMQSGNIIEVGNQSQEIVETIDITVQLLLYKDQNLIELTRIIELYDLDSSEFSNSQTLGEIIEEINKTLSSVYANCRFTKIHIQSQQIEIIKDMYNLPVKNITKSASFQIEAQITE